tara:strand:+ start:4283 stop:5974 length:1692 start_codon:yes stop_codon:yes gene_type:complete
MEEKIKWVVKDNKLNEDASQLSNELNVDIIIAEMLVSRGIKTFDQSKSFFRPNISQLHDPFLMRDMNIAVERILLAINQKEKIMVYGDYDVDGISSVALMSSFLKDMGAIVSTYIPDRSEGYGLSTNGIEEAYEKNQTLIITLDCGINAIQQSKFASEKGIDLVICDHHLPSEALPKACAILNPKRKDCNYPFKELCGCGIGFKLIQAINNKIGKKIENILHFLDLVAIACAADIVSLEGENRTLTFLGLRQLNSKPRLGIKLLINQKSKIKINDLLFFIAPRINAAGRLAKPSIGLRLLTETKKDKLIEIINTIEELNSKRREVEKSMANQAFEKIKSSTNNNFYSSVVCQDDWHKGVIGIVASRLIDKFYKPTIVFCESKKGELTGSGRSIKNVDIHEILSRCEEYILSYGGHKYAAGLKIAKKNLISFSQKFDEESGKLLNNNLPSKQILIESEINLRSITPKFFRILNQFQPFGPANKTPIFLSKNLEVFGDIHKVGKNKEHLKINISQDRENIFSAIGFNLSSKIEILETSNFDMVYTIEENIWNGKSTIQLNIKDIK